MEYKDGKNDNQTAPENLIPDSAAVQNRNKKQAKSKGHPTKSSQKKSNKKSLLETWRSFAPSRRWEIGLLALAAAGAVGYLIAYITVSMLQSSQAQKQHMPTIIHNRPPALLQSFACDAAKSIASTGNMEVFWKNIGQSTAEHVTWQKMKAKIIPEKKTGDPNVDDPPVITEATCSRIVDDGKGTKLDAGVATGFHIRASSGPIPPFEVGTVVQFYFAHCIFYSDSYGKHHGTCDSYRLFTPSQGSPLDTILGTRSIVCDGREVMGRFGPTVNGHCEN